MLLLYMFRVESEIDLLIGCRPRELAGSERLADFGYCASVL